jgi:predicted thioredoxin/glutaredoxin
VPTPTLYTRHGCALCEEFLAELEPWGAEHSVPVEVRDVDIDETTRRRYGLKVPVLEFDGIAVCHGRLDLVELERLIRPRASSR